MVEKGIWLGEGGRQRSINGMNKGGEELGKIGWKNRCGGVAYGLMTGKVLKRGAQGDQRRTTCRVM